MSKTNNIKKSIYNIKNNTKSRISNVFLYKPLSSEEDNIKDSKPKIENIRVSSSFTIFPLSKKYLNLKSLKIYQSKNRYTHFSSTPNINNFSQTNNNKNNLLTHQSFNYRYIKPVPVDLSLYTILAINKNKILYKFNKDINDCKKGKISKLKYLRNKNYINECKEKNKNENIFESKRDKIIYLSLINKNFSNSEKIRFYNMMEKLNQIKLFIEVNQDNECDIVKKFFINLGLNSKMYLMKNKIDNFLKFIKSDFIVDPSKTFKKNVINIINNNNDYISYQKNLKNYGHILSTPKKYNDKKIENVAHLYNTLYKNKNLNYNSYDKFKIDRFDLNLKLNLKRQTEIYKRHTKTKYFDIIKDPEKVMDSLEDKLKEEKNNILFDKTSINWSRNLKYSRYHSYNKMNLIKSYDMDKLRKKNLLTEYACFIKAKDNLDFKQIKLKYKI